MYLRNVFSYFCLLLYTTNGSLNISWLCLPPFGRGWQRVYFPWNDKKITSNTEQTMSSIWTDLSKPQAYAVIMSNTVKETSLLLNYGTRSGVRIPLFFAIWLYTEIYTNCYPDHLIKTAGFTSDSCEWIFIIHNFNCDLQTRPDSLGTLVVPCCTLLMPKAVISASFVRSHKFTLQTSA